MINIDPADTSIPKTKCSPKLLLLGFSFPLAAAAVSECLRRFDLPVALRIALVAVPLLAWTIYIRSMLSTYRRILDELQLRIFLDALAFIAPALIGVAVSVEVLRHGGLLLNFRWTSLSLGLAMLILGSIGAIVSRRRFE